MELQFHTATQKSVENLMRDEKKMEQSVGKNPTAGPTHSMEHGTNVLRKFDSDKKLTLNRGLLKGGSHIFLFSKRPYTFALQLPKVRYEDKGSQLI